MWFTGLQKYSRKEIQFPRKEETFQKHDNTLRQQMKIFWLQKENSTAFPQITSCGQDGQKPWEHEVSSQTVTMSTLPAQAGEAPQQP